MRILAALRLLATAALVSAQNLSDAQVALIKQNLAIGATHSWEIGTRAQTLLELDASPFSVLNASTTVPPPVPLSRVSNASLSEVFDIARSAVSALPSGFASNASGQPLIDGDGAAGDPASIGVAVLLANWTGLQGADYAGAAQAQARFLLNSVPRTSDGAISHRVDQVQLWSDSVYMVPPFLAYLGVTTGNQSMVQEAYNQIKLYRQYLRDSNGAWRHITLGSFNDTGHWSTGNGWAASGMLRVLGTMKNSRFSGSFKSQMNDLANWALEIQSAMYKNVTSSALFTNYADDPSSFADASSTALVAASVYRLSLLANRHTNLPHAERARAALFAMNGTSPADATTLAAPQASSVAAVSSSAASAASRSASVSASAASRSASVSASAASASASVTSNSSAASTASSTAPAASATAPVGFTSASHITRDGWLTPVVNPESFSAQGAASPESEAFALMLHAAWADWVAAGSVGANGASRMRGDVSLAGVVVAGVVGVLVGMLV